MEMEGRFQLFVTVELYLKILNKSDLKVKVENLIHLLNHFKFAQVIANFIIMRKDMLEL
jgi:hypothetical protein